MPFRPNPASSRSLFIDALKVVASQLIVLHHLAFYGPMADIAASLAPELFDWLAHDARMAVQVFLVIGGFMAIKTLAPQRRLVTVQPMASLGQRAIRLSLPYWFALALTLALTSIARLWMDHPSLSPVPTLPELAANILLVQDVVDLDAISAGAWYVAIDLQLFATLLLLLWFVRALSQRLRLSAATQARVSVTLTLSATAAALFHFNLDASWSNWALYFAGSYGLGVAAWWSGDRSVSRWWLIALLGLGAAALWFHWRDRLLVALVTATALALYRRGQVVHQTGWRPVRRAVATLPRLLGRGSELGARLIQNLGATSYALFLAHFPVCLVVNALFFAFLPQTAGWQLTGVALAWAGSLAAAQIFYAWVEAPAQVLTRSPRRNAEAPLLS